MRKKTAFLVIFVLFPGLVSAEEARILAISGAVEARQAREGQREAQDVWLHDTLLSCARRGRGAAPAGGTGFSSRLPGATW